MNKKRGSILILALWFLTVLSVLAMNLGIGVRQRITLLSRLEARHKLNLITASGMKKAVILIRQSFLSNPNAMTVVSKSYLHNNPMQFHPVNFSDGKAIISYTYSDLYSSPQEFFGVVDEASKINLNTTSADILKDLIKRVLNLDDTRAQKIAGQIIDWREFGESEIEGFYSDSFTENLQDPYPSKNANFELLDELFLLPMISPEIYSVLKNYVTIYGNGQININTASRPVLLAVGVQEELADKILVARRGPDGVEATADDHVFQKTYDIASEINSIVQLKDTERAQLDQINELQIFNTFSNYYSIFVKGYLNDSEAHALVWSVYNPIENKIVYYKENY